MSQKGPITVYSFADVSLVLSHPAVGQCTITGEGVGTVTVTLANDVTAHDVAADGGVMISKITADNGSLAIAIQQTSAAHKWLTKYYNYVKNAPTDEWAQMTGILRNPQQGETTTFVGVSPQKLADRGYQQTGQQVTWTLMAGEITEQ